MAQIDLADDSDLDDWFLNSVNRLSHGTSEDLAAFLHSVGSEVVLEGTRTRCRCHFVALDGNGRPLVEKLARKLHGQVVDYCIPRSRIKAALQHHQETGSIEHLVRLNREAAELFAAVEKSGEAGEVLLIRIRSLGSRRPAC